MHELHDVATIPDKNDDQSAIIAIAMFGVVEHQEPLKGSCSSATPKGLVGYN